MSSKLSFRSRQVDYMKPLPIFMSQDLPDLADVAAINRSVPQMPTGMEKDEECEHHLQRALSALQAFGAVATTSSSEYAIPTPKVDAIDDKVYENIYSIQLPKLLKQYIRIQPFSNDYDYPDYDADVDDEAWLNEERNKLGFACEDLVLFFENVMDRLEKVTGHSTNIMSREEAKILLTKESDDLAASCFSNINSSKSTPLKSGLSAASDASKKQRDEFVMCIYEYWKAKRLKYKHPLTPTVLTDKSGVVTQPNNPYLVFRRRTEKMQTRKNRKTEEQSYEKMLILKRDLLKAQQILKFIKQRESMKKELVKMAMEGFEKRFKLNDYDGHVTESIKASLKPASSAAQANNYYANAALSALANSSNSNSLMNFHNRINNINKSAAAAASAAGVQSSIERTIAMIGSSSSSTSAANKLKSFTTHLSNNNFKRNNDQYDTTTVNNNNKKQRNKDRNRTSSSQQHVNNLEQQQQQVKKASPPQAGSALFKKPPSLTVNQLTQQQQQQQQQQQTSMSTKNRLIRRLTSQRSSVEGDQQQPVSAVANSETAETKAANYFLVECNEYDEELRLNEINNLDALLTETQNKLSTSVDKDGYWCFKRKEGCKYLAQNGSIFKNDALDYFSELNKTSNAALVSRLTLEEEQYTSTTKTMRTTQSTSNTSSELNTSKKRKRARELQHYYCGYAMDAALNRHLGLVRRRMGRGGRVLLERVRPEAVEKLAAHQDDSTTIASSTSTVSTSPPQSAPLSQDAFASFKTYYPIESAAASLHTADGSSSTIFAVVPNINSKRLKLMEDDTSSSSEDDEKDEKESGVGSGKPSELTRYDHRLYLTHSYEFESYGRHPSEDEEEDDDDESILSEDEEEDDEEEEDVNEEDEEFVMHEDGRRVRMRSTKPVNDEHRRLDDESMMELDESRRREALRALVGLRRPQTDAESRHEDERTGNNEPSSSSSSQQQQIHAPIKIEPSPKRSSPSPPTPPPSSSSSSSSQTSTPVVMTCNGYPSSPINFSGQTNSGKLQQSVNNHQSEQLIVNKIVNNSSSISSSVFYSAASSSSSNEPVVVSSSTPTSNGSTASSQQPSNGPPAKVLGTMMKESSQSQLASTNHNHHATTNPTYQLTNTSPSSSPATNNSSTSTPTYNSNTNAYSTICSK